MIPDHKCRQRRLVSRFAEQLLLRKGLTISFSYGAARPPDSLDACLEAGRYSGLPCAG